MCRIRKNEVVNSIVTYHVKGTSCYYRYPPDPPTQPEPDPPDPPTQPEPDPPPPPIIVIVDD